GQTNSFALFECSCTKYYRRPVLGEWILGTNHFCTIEDPARGTLDFEDSLQRFRHAEGLLSNCHARRATVNMPWDMVRILGDARVEQRGDNPNSLITTCADVACPGRGILWRTVDGFPAA